MVELRRMQGTDETDFITNIKSLMTVKIEVRLSRPVLFFNGRLSGGYGGCRRGISGVSRPAPGYILQGGDGGRSA